MRVKSAVDLWYKILMCVTAGILIVSIFISPPDGRLIAAAVILPIMTFLAWIYIGTYYELREYYLYCRSGPFTEKIPYDKIKSVKLRENILSSMALSTKRIEIIQLGRGYITGTTFISPLNREKFLSELEKKCRNLKNIEGNNSK